MRITDPRTLYFWKRITGKFNYRVSIVPSRTLSMHAGNIFSASFCLFGNILSHWLEETVPPLCAMVGVDADGLPYTTLRVLLSLGLCCRGSMST
jgi:hypothetical protein